MSPWVGFTEESTAGIPAGLLQGLALASHKERKGDVSVTQLIAPPQLTALAARHDYVSDADEQLWAIFGKALHNVFAQGSGDGEHSEETLTIDQAGVIVEGTPDLWDDSMLTDLKSTSVFSAKDGLPKADWISQVNLYAHLLRRTRIWGGNNSAKAQAVVLFRDWRKGEAQKYPWYPPKRMMVYPIPLWPAAQAEAYLAERLELWLAAREMSDTVLAEEIPCTDEETWQERRCQTYCPAAPWCCQWARRNDAPDPTASW